MKTICWLQNNAEITVKIESTGADAKVSISSSTTARNVVEMLARSPKIQRRFSFRFSQIQCFDTVGWAAGRASSL